MTDARRDLIKSLDELKQYIEYKTRDLSRDELESVLNAATEKLIEKR
ncbi:MAG: hypothetical protein E7C49_19420 [Clostridium sp.]|nr:hypothetical protein [Clostridium sp.]